ncbi:hypothetical protein MM707_28930, partial [Klebsiella pneumoniae]|nr:hypothetical protein [Klebsiella pneumoniae]
YRGRQRHRNPQRRFEPVALSVLSWKALRFSGISKLEAVGKSFFRRPFVSKFGYPINKINNNYYHTH